jgi:transcriptional regulator NrdR family protein
MRVVESRPHKNTVKRRRECVYCETRYTTFETFADDIANPAAVDALHEEAREAIRRLNSHVAETRDISVRLQTLVKKTDATR